MLASNQLGYVSAHDLLRRFRVAACLQPISRARQRGTAILRVLVSSRRANADFVLITLRELGLDEIAGYYRTVCKVHNDMRGRL